VTNRAIRTTANDGGVGGDEDGFENSVSFLGEITVTRPIYHTGGKPYSVDDSVPLDGNHVAVVVSVNELASEGTLGHCPQEKTQKNCQPHHDGDLRKTVHGSLLSPYVGRFSRRCKKHVSKMLTLYPHQYLQNL